METGKKKTKKKRETNPVLLFSVVYLSIYIFVNTNSRRKLRALIGFILCSREVFFVCMCKYF